MRRWSKLADLEPPVANVSYPTLRDKVEINQTKESLKGDKFLKGVSSKNLERVFQ